MPPFLPFSEARKNASKNPRQLAIYLIIINAVILLISILLHELGHLGVGILIGCVGGNIAISNIINPILPGLYTTLSCPASVATGINGLVILLGLSGFLFVIPFALIFAAFRKNAEKHIAIIVIGFSIILAGMDLLLIVSNILAVYAALVAGICIMCIGEIFLSAEHTEYSVHMKSAKKAAISVSKHHHRR